MDIIQEAMQQIKKNRFSKTASKSFINGLSTVSNSFEGLLKPIAKYTISNYVNANPPVIASDINFGKPMGVQEILVDVDKTIPSHTNLTAFYNDKIVTAHERYNEYTVTCYGRNHKEASDWMKAFQYAMKTQNQYRGKCLYAEYGGIEFKEIPEANWDDVVLNDNIKRDIRMNAISFFENKKLSSTGITKRGIIMYGPPGTGKTSVVKAIFKELEGKKISRVYVTSESFKKMSASDLFNLLPYLGPSVLAFEDIDMVGQSRDIIASSGGILGDLLTNLDGMRKFNDQLVVIASTNKISMLDEALANRPCRFDRRIELGLPGSEQIKKIYFKLVGQDVNDDIIKMSDKFTGSHIVETVNTAKILAANENKEVLACMNEACNIIRDNFFPGQTQQQIKEARKSYFIKKSSKNRIVKIAKVIMKSRS